MTHELNTGGDRGYLRIATEEAFATQAQMDAILRLVKEGRADKGTEVMPGHLQKVVAISCVMRAADALTCWSIGDETSDEAELIQKFFHGIDRYHPVLVSWKYGNVTDGLRIVRVWFLLAVPFGFSIMLLRLAQSIWRDIGDLREGRAHFTGRKLFD